MDPMDQQRQHYLAEIQDAERRLEQIRKCRIYAKKDGGMFDITEATIQPIEDNLKTNQALFEICGGDLRQLAQRQRVESITIGRIFGLIYKLFSNPANS